MSKRAVSSTKTTTCAPVIVTVDPTECPFREFRDNELQPEFWGMGPATFRAYSALTKQSGSSKSSQDQIWIDDQTQPLPRSVRRYLDGWIRAEELAESRWESEVVIFEEETNGGKMLIQDIQLSHAQVLLRSAFCRDVLSACFMLEKTETVTVEHQWENFICNFGPEGWRAKYHIYSPGLKPGGGTQHRPVLSKNGCYLVRLYYLGAWRCVWVSDQVPVDATGAPLLPFSPLLSKAPASKPGVKQAPPTVTAQDVYLWPLLLCKALLKLAAPDMNSDEFAGTLEDEAMLEFNILHALTGGLNMNYLIKDKQALWDLITAEVPLFSWDDDEDTHTSTVKSKSTKKPIGKETVSTKSRGTLVYAIIKETKDFPPYYLPGITPGCGMSLLIRMARDLPLKKPLPEPEVALWKHHRWVDWARGHGLYEAYDCPRTKFLKANGLMKLSYAPHLLDVQSTESITAGFLRVEQSKNNNQPAKGKSKDAKLAPVATTNQPQMKEELREWLKYDAIFELVQSVRMLFFPSLYEITSGASCPPIRITKAPYNKALDIQASKSAPFYLQIDGPETNTLRLSLSMLHPRILANSGVLIDEYIESAHLVLEKFEWFEDCLLPKPKAYVKTCGYDCVEATFVPGRHFCRIWVHSRMNWHLTLMSESTLLLGPRDHIQCAAVRECPWVSKFLMSLGASFANWLRINRSNHFLPSVKMADQEFFRNYQPDLPWDNEVVGYDHALLHWMFRQALQVHLDKRLAYVDRNNVYVVLRKYFCDPNLGLPSNSLPSMSLRLIADLDPCDCLLPELYEGEMLEEHEEEMVEQEAQEEIHLVNADVMAKLLEPPKPPVASNICEFATEELPCGVLKEEREKVIKKHEAATTIQAHWRGAWARKCLKIHVTATPEVLKALQDAVYGNQECLMSLMNEFFRMYPGAKHAYSVSSALSGVYGLHQYNGISPVTSRCKWIPYFQGVFFCHASVKVHFDVISSLHHSTIAVYNNDTGMILPQVFNAHKTFDFSPNEHGYTVMGHGSLNETSPFSFDVHWQLTVLSSIEGVFHVCDNEDGCKEISLPPANKIHIDEIFLPNKKNILGGIHLSVTKHEAVSFRAAVTSPDLQIVATLRTLSSNGLLEEISTCSGTGEIFWPYIRLEPLLVSHTSQTAISSTPGLSFNSVRSTPKALKKPQSGRSQKSTAKIRPTADPKFYSIEVTAPSGWPLTLNQWRRVDEVRNSTEILRPEGAAKKPPVVKGIMKPNSVRDKATDKRLSFTQTSQTPQPQPGDAFVELECSLALGGGISARRDDERDLIFAAARRAWSENEPGRNQRGAEIRKLFREENLVAPPPSESSHSTTADFATLYEGLEGEENMEDILKKEEPPGPTPATESGMLEMSVEDEEEIKYYEMPEQLKDKFVPLDFLGFCTKEIGEDNRIVISWDMAEAAKKERQMRIAAALERMRELQSFNEVHMLGRQRTRSQMLDKLNVDARWSANLLQALEERDEAIAQETLLRINSANKKKQQQKNETATKQQPKSKK